MKVFPSHIQGIFAFLYKKAADNNSEEGTVLFTIDITGWNIYNPMQEYEVSQRVTTVKVFILHFLCCL